ncbi:ester cyclase [Terrabacter sp. NPDC000476]|uniref:ester cyclase n=1 Tax=Terrabacter sp. NPDC000476 TaxID=3154258 RepID=UPI0033215621
MTDHTHTTPVMATRDGLPAAVAALDRIMREGFMTGDVSVVDDLCAPDLVEHQFGLAGSASQAIEHVKDAIRDVHAMMPDSSVELADWAVRDDTAWCRFVVSGTQTGPFFGPPSGCPVTLTVIDVARVVEGRIVEHWGVPDRFAILAQAGLLQRLAPTT